MYLVFFVWSCYCMIYKTPVQQKCVNTNKRVCCMLQSEVLGTNPGSCCPVCQGHNSTCREESQVYKVRLIHDVMLHKL